MSYRIQQLRYQLREDPSSRAFLRLAGLLRDAGETVEAVDVLRQGLVHHPRFLAAWLALGRALRDVGDGAVAEEAFGRVLAIQPAHPEAAVAVAEAAVARGDWSAADGLLEPLGELEAPELEARRADLGSRIAEEERRRAAEEAARRAAEEEAARLRQERRARPPVDVADAVDGIDPFADLTGVGIKADTTVQDVFATEEQAGAEASAQVEPLAKEAVEVLEETEPESWADVADEVAAVSELEEPLTEEEVTGEPAPVLEPIELEEPATAAVEAVVEPLVEEAVEDLEPPPESWADVADEVAAVSELEEPLTGHITAEPAVAVEAPGPEDQAVAVDDDGPLPTLTLARLAAHQGAHDLAITTLERLLAREPENLEAVELLDRLRGGGSDRTRRAGSVAKIAALRAWLDTIRLASERQGP